MLLSRIFSLILGTILFVMTWSMQDGDHSLRKRPEVDAKPLIRRLEVEPETRPSPSVSSHPVRVTSIVAVAPESALWMFADDPAAQVAAK